jgi:hypothetical protein
VMAVWRWLLTGGEYTKYRTFSAVRPSEL